MSSGLYSGVSGLALGIGLYRGVSGLWGGASGLIDGFAGGSPYSGASLYLDFLSMTAASFDNRITFSRGTGATLTDSTGRITYAPSNLLLRSQEFDNAAWGKQNGATVSADTTIAPDGTTTADTVTSGNGQTSSAIFQAQTLATNVTHTFSVYIRAGTASTASIGAFASGSFLSAIASIVSGPGSVSGTGLINISGLSTTDWTRVRYTVTGTGVSASLLIYPETTSTGTGKSVILWGAQLEPVTYQTTPSTYVATTSAAYYGPRFDYDPVTLAARGLLIEEQRTNLLLRSAEFDNASWGKSSATVTANSTISPDGTANADTLTPNSSISGVVEQDVTFTGNGDKAVSIFLKAGTSTTTYVFVRDTTVPATRGRALITWTGGVPSATADNGGTIQGVDNFGNGWYRLRLLATNVVAANANAFRVQPDPIAGTGSVIAWGAQAENGAFATSYIPTVASQVTRNADVATMTGTNFSSWYNQSEGTFIFSGDSITVPSFSYPLLASDGTFANRFGIYTSGSSAAGLVVSSSATQMDISALPVIANVPFKAAVAAQTNNGNFSFNGNIGTTDTTITMPVVNRLTIGAGFVGAGEYINGHVRTVVYYNTRLPNSQLQTLTT